MIRAIGFGVLVVLAATSASVSQEKKTPPKSKGFRPAESPPKREKPEVFTTVEQLLAGLPADAHPKQGNDGVPNNVAARLWMRERLIGHRVKQTVAVTGVTFEDRNTFVRVIVRTNARQAGVGKDRVNGSMTLGDAGKMGTEPCEVILTDGLSLGGTVIYESCTPAEARRAKEFVGKEVVIEVTITDIGYGGVYTELRSKPKAGDWADARSGALVNLLVSLPTLDGWLPAAHAPKDAK